MREKILPRGINAPKIIQEISQQLSGERRRRGRRSPEMVAPVHGGGREGNIYIMSKFKTWNETSEIILSLSLSLYLDKETSEIILSLSLSLSLSLMYKDWQNGPIKVKLGEIIEKRAVFRLFLHQGLWWQNCPSLSEQGGIHIKQGKMVIKFNNKKINEIYIHLDNTSIQN